MATYNVSTTAGGTTLNKGDTMNVLSGGIANETIVNSNGYLYISSGGTTNNTSVNGFGNLYVKNGGTANLTTVSGWNASMWVSSGGIATNTTVNSLGYLYISSGGVANRTTINASANLIVSSGGTATDIVWTPCVGQVTIRNGGYATFASNYSGVYYGNGYQLLTHAKTMTKMSVTTNNGYSIMCVMSGGSAEVAVGVNGQLYVYSGGTVNNTNVGGFGVLTVSNGGIANNTTAGGVMYVSSGGMANNTKVTDYLGVYDGGTASSTQVNGGMSVGSGGTAIDTNVTGYLYVNSGGTATRTTVNSGGSILIYGIVTSTTINFGGSMFVSDGTVTSTTVNFGGSLFINSGSINNTTVKSGGIMEVRVGYGSATASSLTVQSGGRVSVLDSIEADDWTIEDGASVSCAGIYFNLTNHTEASDVIIADLARISGNTEYSIRVLRDQEVGTYKLAGFASAFTDTMEVVVNEYHNYTTLGTVKVGEEAMQSGAYSYALTQENNTISLTISLNVDLPDAPTVTADITTPTNQDVTLSAVYSEDSVTKQYSLDRTTWRIYNAPVTVSENGTYYFRGLQEDGYAGKVTTITVDNIDKIAPDAPTVTASTTETTWDNVILTVTYSGDTAKKQYSLNGTDWMNGAGSLSVGENGTYYFRGIDAAGNISAVTSHTVSNIDKTAPPKVTASTVKPTNQFVTLTAIYSDGSVKRQYSFDNSDWQNYTGPVTVTENRTVYFRGVDGSGDPMTVTAYEVKNIDRVAPDAPVVTASTEAPTNQDVTLSVVFSDDTATKQYSTDNKTWKSYTGAITVSANGTRYFRGIDEAGNVSQVVSYTVSNIDRTAPPAPTVKADITALTNRNVTLTATCSDDTATMQYSTDKQTWLTFRGTVAASANGTYYFRGIDAAGNISKITSFKVTNIDRTAPKAPTVWASTTLLTNKNVTLTATFSSDTKTKQYSTDNKTWKSYTKAVSVSANGTWYFRGIDAAGNPSPVTSCKVSNIDKVAPVAPTVKASTTAATNKAVTLTATFSSDTRTKQYSTDNKTWKSYSSGISASANGTWYFRGIDAAGNVSKVTSFKVANIDRTAPAAPTVKVSTTEWTNGKVSLTAAFSSDTKTKQYSTDGKTWKIYSGAVTASANGTWYFRGIDAAGNVSKVKSYKVSNITATRAPSGIAAQTDRNNVTCTWEKYAAQKGVKISYQVKVDGSSQVKTVSAAKFTLKKAAAGAHTLSVRTVSRQGDRVECSPWRTLSLTVADVIAPKLVAVGSSVKGCTGTVLCAASDNVAVDHYTVTLNGVTKTVAGTKNSASFTDLAVGKYTASVQAFDAAGNASKVKKVKFTVKDVTAPGKVTGFSAVSMNKGKATLSWDAVSDDSGKAVSYEVELSTGKLVKTGKTSCSVKLAAGSYTCRVRAIDKAKNVGAWSAAQKFSIATAAKSAAIALSYCDTLRLDSALQAAADAGPLTANAVREQAYLAAL